MLQIPTTHKCVQINVAAMQKVDVCMSKQSRSCLALLTASKSKVDYIPEDPSSLQMQYHQIITQNRTVPEKCCYPIVP